MRRLFAGSFGYFAQPWYWRADYGYRGDWETRRIVLFVRRADHEGLALDAILRRVRELRNVVVEMAAELEAVKPVRAPDRSLQRAPQLVVQWAE